VAVSGNPAAGPAPLVHGVGQLDPAVHAELGHANTNEELVLAARAELAAGR
jgi:hypothetical protein